MPRSKRLSDDDATSDEVFPQRVSRPRRSKRNRTIILDDDVEISPKRKKKEVKKRKLSLGDDTPEKPVKKKKIEVIDLEDEPEYDEPAYEPEMDVEEEGEAYAPEEPKPKKKPKKKTTKKQTKTKEKKPKTTTKPTASKKTKTRTTKKSKIDKSKPAKSSVKGNEAASMILNYMKEQNRPYNYVAVFDNLRKVVSKTEVKRALEKLAKGGQVATKEFGKAKVYFALQDVEVTPEELVELDDQVKQLHEEKKLQTNENTQLKKTYKNLTTYPNDNDLDAAIETLESEIEALETNVEQAKTAAVSTEDMQKTEKQFEKFYKCWRKRRKAAWDAANALIGERKMKPKKMLKDLDCEFDEEYNVDVKDYKELLPKKKKFVRPIIKKKTKKKKVV